MEIPYCIENYCCSPDVCSNAGVRPINLSSFHKLCELHLGLLQSNQFLQCGYCGSICLVTELPITPQVLPICSICEARPIYDSSSDFCEICRQKCSKCSQISKDLIITECNQKLCSQCLSVSTCCNYCCILCKTHSETFTLECNKIMCQKCFFGYGCCQDLCWNCRKHKSKKTECGKLLCNDCDFDKICCNYCCIICKTHSETFTLECNKIMCQKCFFDNGCCQDLCWNCKKHKGRKTECGKLLCNECDSDMICCQFLCINCKIYHNNTYENSLCIDCEQNSKKIEKIEFPALSSGSDENGYMPNSQNFHPSSLKINDFSLKARNVDPLSSESSHESSSLTNQKTNEAINEEEKIQNNEQFDKYKNIGSIPQSLQKLGDESYAEDDHPLKPENNKKYARFCQEEEAKRKDFNEELKYEFNHMQNPRNAGNYQSLIFFKDKSVKTNKYNAHCSVCNNKASYECADEIFFCEACFNHQFLNEVPVFECFFCNQKRASLEFTQDHPKKICKDCIHNLKFQNVCINCKVSANNNKLLCYHSLCRQCLSGTKGKCSFCESKFIRCEMCAQTGFNKQRFQICRHPGCENCCVYQYCFNCISSFKRNDLKSKLNLQKSKFQCKSCLKSHNHGINLICKHQVCRDCTLEGFNFDFCCHECYLKIEKKVCLQCRKDFTLIPKNDNLAKSCCLKIIKYERKISIFKGVHHKLSVKNEPITKKK